MTTEDRLESICDNVWVDRELWEIREWERGQQKETDK